MKRMIQTIMHEQLEISPDSPLKVKWCDYDHFRFPMHVHAAYEIVYVVKSSGVRFAGNNVVAFTDGDLVLYGTYLSHMYRSDPIYYQDDPRLRVHAVTIQFSEEFFSQALRDYPEFGRIRSLLESARQGVCFDGDGRNAMIRERIVELLDLQGAERLIECLRILSMMSRTPYKRLLDNNIVESDPVEYSDRRIMKILAYLNENYLGQINLYQVASLSGMNSAAFCRYFREKTGKSLLQYVNTLRVGYACRLLVDGQMSIARIGYECGYNNLSNFNRHFKKITGYTPSDYLVEFSRSKGVGIALM